MISRGRTLMPRVHLPLRRLALCLDCDEGFEIGSGTCPACGSETWTSLSRFLEQASSSRRLPRLDGNPSAAKRHDEQPEMVRQLIIVARNRPELCERLKRAFAGNATVRVVLDRRVAERRGRSGSHAGERRQGDRRSPLMLDELLRATGWAIVPQDVTKKHRGSA
jgi:hypothetical protein